MAKYAQVRLILSIFLVLTSFACVTGTISPAPIQPENCSPTPLARLGPPIADDLKVILPRLEIKYLGKDGHRVIGSGCPGNDGRGSVDNYHFVISGVDKYRTVTRVVVLGDNSTLTWA
jgi:hypothetical protein